MIERDVHNYRKVHVNCNDRIYYRNPMIENRYNDEIQQNPDPDFKWIIGQQY